MWNGVNYIKHGLHCCVKMKLLYNIYIFICWTLCYSILHVKLGLKYFFIKFKNTSENFVCKFHIPMFKVQW